MKYTPEEQARYDAAFAQAKAELAQQRADLTPLRRSEDYTDSRRSGVADAKAEGSDPFPAWRFDEGRWEEWLHSLVGKDINPEFKP